MRRPGPLGLPLTAKLQPREARALLLAFSTLGAALVLAIAHAVGGFGGAALDRVLRDGVTSAVYVLVAAIVTLRAVRSTDHRRSWTLFAIGLALYAVGNVLWAFWLEHVTNPPIPSICDALWLALYPLCYVGIVGVARVRGQRQASPNLWLDGLIAGAGLAAIGAAFVFRPVLAAASGGAIAVATELAYPVADLLLAALVVGMLALRGWRLDYAWGLLAAGFLALALADCIYAVDVANGSTVSSGSANVFYMLGVILLAVAAWQVEPAEQARRAVRWSVLLMPALFTLGALGLLVYDHFHRLDPVALGLAILTLLAAIARLAIAFRDVASLVEARRQASTDDLTLLPNRRLLVASTNRAIAAARLAGDTLAVLVLDLDNFKELNDTLGHEAGDALLRRIGPRLKHSLRSTDTVARLGGDEFAILVDRLPEAAAAARVAEKMQRALAVPFALEGLRLSLTAGVGIASFPDDADDADELLRRAGIAKSLAKAGRCGVAFYAPERDPNSRDRLMLAGELAAAIEDGEIEVHFQPKVDACSRRIVGAEALLRWRRHDGTLLVPDQFIAAAEKAGLSRVLTRFVLARALELARKWRDDGRELHVAINTAVADLLDTDFPNELQRGLEALELPPSMLVLEMTENAVLSDPIRINDVLGRLGELGVDLSLDDFGTGCSSLSHLRALPIREVKIDRTFVSWMREDPRDTAIFHATIDLAHRLGMRVVAEGVEDYQTWQTLAELGCDVIQGFVFAPAVHPQELDRLLTVAPPRWVDLGDAEAWDAV